MITVNGIQYYGEVYERTNTVNGNVYVGQTIRDDDPRWSECLSEARAGRGYRLGAALRKYGEVVFTRSRRYLVKLQPDLEKCQLELDRMETFFIILHQSHIKGYNVALGGNGRLGVRGSHWTHKPESIEKIRIKALGNKRGIGNKSRTGQKCSFESIEKARIANTGRKDTPETIEKKKKALLGKNTSEKYERTKRYRQERSQYAIEHGFGRWLKGKRSKKKRTRMRICYTCFKTFDSTGAPDRTFCSSSCASKTYTVLRKTSEECLKDAA
jgi:hypothetical protein